MLSKWSCCLECAHCSAHCACTRLYKNDPDPFFLQVGKIYLRSLLITILCGGLFILANNLMYFFLLDFLSLRWWGEGVSNTWHPSIFSKNLQVKWLMIFVNKRSRNVSIFGIMSPLNKWYNSTSSCIYHPNRIQIRIFPLFFWFIQRS